MRPPRQPLDRIADRGIAFLWGLWEASGLLAASEREGYLITLVQRATQGAREGNG